MEVQTELVKDFTKAWSGIKSLLDIQAEQLETITKTVGLLIEESEQRDLVIKKMIDKQY